jgi:hypothetical protein
MSDAALDQKIKEAAAETSKAIEVLKPGWTTSEAHFTAIVNLLGIASTVVGLFQDNIYAKIALIVLGALSSVLTTLNYQNNRTALKQ